MLASRFLRACVIGLISYFGVLSASSVALTDEEIRKYSRNLIFSAGVVRDEALEKLAEHGDPEIAAVLILGMRYLRPDEPIAEVFQKVTGSDAKDWFEAMLWQERNPQVKAHPSFRDIKISAFASIDQDFLRFLSADTTDPNRMDIRLEEITWGGVHVDGIPSLDNPDLLTPDEATYLLDDDLVFGVSINGDTRAYPLRIMGWHEMFNEVIGGVPVALAYCTLCGSGILFETDVEGQADPFVFGSSGFLYRSNKLMFDRQTNSLWNQFTGEPVVGPLRGSGIKLKIRPVVITTWVKWRTENPSTKVLSIRTGHKRDYGSGVVYQDYFSSPDLMFPTSSNESKGILKKDYVFGIRATGASKAWPLEAFDGYQVLNDTLSGNDLVLIGDQASRTVRAYDVSGQTFTKIEGSQGEIAGPGGRWSVTEDGLMGPEGERLPRVAGHIAYWFAWDGYMGVASELYSAN